MRIFAFLFAGLVLATPNVSEAAFKISPNNRVSQVTINGNYVYVRLASAIPTSVGSTTPMTVLCTSGNASVIANTLGTAKGEAFLKVAQAALLAQSLVAVQVDDASGACLVASFGTTWLTTTQFDVCSSSSTCNPL
jgi:hypothetical protein